MEHIIIKYKNLELLVGYIWRGLAERGGVNRPWEELTVQEVGLSVQRLS